MNVVLWIVQILLAFSFLSHGRTMISPPATMSDRMAQGMRYVRDLPSGFRRFIGVAELLGAAGLILPAATGILPSLTPLAAAGLALVMLGAIIFHVSRREYPNLILNTILLAMSVFVAYGRWFVLPR
jgi:uncharacterized membrane protein YphA (DoxX/SURF4 family)